MYDLLTAWISFLKNPKSMGKTFLKIYEINLAMNRLKHISNSDMRKYQTHYLGVDFSEIARL